MAQSLNTQSSKNSRKQALAGLKARIVKQKALCASKRADLSKFIKQTKQSKKLTMTQKMQNEQTVFQKRSDIYRTKQMLDQLQIAYSKAYHNK